MSEREKKDSIITWKKVGKNLPNDKCSAYAAFFNDIDLGTAEIDDGDGFYYFWFNKDIIGSWQALWLRSIADKLDSLNEDWIKELDEAYGKYN